MVMRRAPKDVHREVLKRDERDFGNEPSWYAVWLGPPHGEKSVLLGRAERLPTARWWRAFPVTGEYPEQILTFNKLIAYLLEVRAAHQEAAQSV
jgi:hypothetical protein